MTFGAGVASAWVSPIEELRSLQGVLSAVMVEAVERGRIYRGFRAEVEHVAPGWMLDPAAGSGGSIQPSDAETMTLITGGMDLASFVRVVQAHAGAAAADPAQMQEVFRLLARTLGGAMTAKEMFDQVEAHGFRAVAVLALVVVALLPAFLAMTDRPRRPRPRLRLP